MEGITETETQRLIRQNDALKRQLSMYGDLLTHIINHSKDKESFTIVDVLTMIASVMRT